jgi:hypothetical protein
MRGRFKGGHALRLAFTVLIVTAISGPAWAVEMRGGAPPEAGAPLDLLGADDPPSPPPTPSPLPTPEPSPEPTPEPTPSPTPDPSPDPSPSPDPTPSPDPSPSPSPDDGPSPTPQPDPPPDVDPPSGTTTPGVSVDTSEDELLLKLQDAGTNPSGEGKKTGAAASDLAGFDAQGVLDDHAAWIDSISSTIAGLQFAGSSGSVLTSSCPAGPCRPSLGGSEPFGFILVGIAAVAVVVGALVKRARGGASGVR